MKSIVLRPRLSEKTYALSQARNTYVFEVPANANKHEVKAAVAAQFAVSVTGVRLTNIAGKAKRAYRKRGRSISATRSGVSKAYVTLAEGNTLPIFAVEEAKTTEKGSK